METNNKKDRRDDIFSRNVRAGKRTYFFDVKATRADDYYLTITESAKRFNDDGSFYYEKHRLFLYKEDFEKFSNCLAEVTKYIVDERGVTPIRGESKNYHNNGSQNSNLNAVPPIVAEEIGQPKSEEEVDLVEDAHEKAISGENIEVNGNIDNSQSDHTLEQEDISENTESTESKSE